ncbi:hypothetical protein M0R45_027370 [Rubus argutus]|uniref:Uncharacterized protein n=1 Tax=Rubus argutus TaxID=59490 RepID=A0AAW1X0A4_RUBAR
MYSPLADATAQGLVEIPYRQSQNSCSIFCSCSSHSPTSPFTAWRLLVSLLLYTWHSVISSVHFTLCGISSLVSLFSNQTSRAGGFGSTTSAQLGGHLEVLRALKGTVKEYLEVSLGYGPGMIGVSVAVLLGFNVLFFGIFSFSIKALE